MSGETTRALPSMRNLGTQRTPPFEVWGVLIKAVQVVTLAALVDLTVRPATRVGAR